MVGVYSSILAVLSLLTLNYYSELKCTDRCSQYNNCQECLDNGCVRSAGQCLNQCFIDVSCYDSGAASATAISAELCAVEAAELLDNAACITEENDSCELCTTTSRPSDPSKTCMWFEDMGMCFTECGPHGCGYGTTDSAQCANETTRTDDRLSRSHRRSPRSRSLLAIGDVVVSCEDRSTCTECVVDADCSWTGRRCVDDCYLQEAFCFNTQYFPNDTPSEICRQADNARPGLIKTFLSMLLSFTPVIIFDSESRASLLEVFTATDEEELNDNFE